MGTSDPGKQAPDHPQKAPMKANYGILAVAVCCEVSGSLALKQAADQPLWMLLTLVADGIAFYLLSVLLRRGMPLSVAYGLWGAGGVALTALLSTVLFGEPFTLLMGAGIALVIAGVLLVEFGADHSADHAGSTDARADASSDAGDGQDAASVFANRGGEAS